MGKPATLLEGLCGYALALGTRAILVERKDGHDHVTASRGETGIPIAKYRSSGSDAKELRRNLGSAAKRAVRVVLNGKVCLLKVRVSERPDEDAFQVSIAPVPAPDLSALPSFTAKQGQYLAYIHYYTKLHRQPPAEADLERYFRVSAPSIHGMIKTLERNSLIEKIPGQARSIRLLVRPEHLPPLE